MAAPHERADEVAAVCMALVRTSAVHRYRTDDVRFGGKNYYLEYHGDVDPNHSCHGRRLSQCPGFEANRKESGCLAGPREYRLTRLVGVVVMERILQTRRSTIYHIETGIFRLKTNSHNRNLLSLLAASGISGQLVLLASAWLLPLVSE